MANIFIGCHISFSKGYEAMAKQAISLGADTFAFFTRNPRGGKAKEPDPSDVEKCNALLKEHNFGPLVAHAPYTMNLCSDKPDIRVFAKDMFADDLRRMELTPFNFYNFHPGSHVGQGVEEGIKVISEVLNEVLTPNMTTTVLLETMAGKGSEIGRSFEELREIIDRVDLKEKLGVCFDTCHTYDAEYDTVNDLDGVIAEFDKVIGLDKLKAVHINDSKNPFGSHKDRHELIGEGSLGIDALKRIVNHPAFAGKPFILETPNDDAGYAKEIAMIRGW